MEKILFADDLDSIRKLYRSILSGYSPNYIIEEYTNGKDVNDKLKEDLSDVVLAILDDHMPVIIQGKELPTITGSEIVKNYASRIPIILCSGDLGEENCIEKDALTNGAYAVFQKPFDFSEFMGKIGEILD